MSVSDHIQVDVVLRMAHAGKCTSSCILQHKMQSSLVCLNLFSFKHYSMSLSSAGIWARGRKIIKHLRSWILTEHDTFTLLP